MHHATGRECRFWWAGLALLTPLSALAEPSLDELLREVERLKERVEQLERERVRPVPAQELNLGLSISGTERAVEAPVEAKPTAPEVHVGGALRFNFVHRDFVEASDGKRGESGLDVFRLNVEGAIDNILVSAEYRFYSYMHTLHHGWIGYQFDDNSQLQFGVHRVPFGLQPYPAHNAWFGVPYYTGLGDDYDMGIKYQREDGPWQWQLAFYKNEELNDSTSAERYSFDLVRSGDQQNEETNQFNGRGAFTFGLGTGCETETGASLQAGELYNHITGRRGDHWAAAAHLDSRCGRWHVQLSGIRYNYSPANPEGMNNDTVQVGAFAGTYDVASRADVLVANLAYNVPSPWKHIDSITCYNDYSQLFKDDAHSRDSRINTLGCAVGMGPIFTYVDYILANNMAYFAEGSMAQGGDNEWHSRFNVNLGFYW